MRRSRRRRKRTSSEEESEVKAGKENQKEHQLVPITQATSVATEDKAIVVYNSASFGFDVSLGLSCVLLKSPRH